MNVRFSRALVAGATLALFAGVLAPSAAQAQTRFGVEAAWGDNVDFGVGAFAKFHLTELSGKAVTGRGEFLYFFPGGVTGYSWHYLEGNFDGLIDLNGGKSSMKPYVGAGVGYSRTSFSYDNGYCSIFGAVCDNSSSDFGVNVIGGLNFGDSKMAPFVEAKYELRSGGQLVLKGGIHFK